MKDPMGTWDMKKSDEISSHLLGAFILPLSKADNQVLLCTSILKHWVLMEGLQLLSSFLLGYGIKVDK